MVKTYVTLGMVSLHEMSHQSNFSILDTLSFLIRFATQWLIHNVQKSQTFPYVTVKRVCPHLYAPEIPVYQQSRPTRPWLLPFNCLQYGCYGPGSNCRWFPTNGHCPGCDIIHVIPNSRQMVYTVLCHLICHIPVV